MARPEAAETARRGRVPWAVASIAAVLLAWQVAAAARIVSPLFLPSPAAVAAALARKLADGSLAADVAVSLGRVLAGFLLGLLVAIPLGLVMGLWPTLYHLIDPWIELVRPIPPIAWIPLAILWFGLGEESKVFIIAYGAFFPIMLNTVLGLRSVEPVHVRAARTLGAGTAQIFWNVVLRAALPRIILGLRLGVGMAFVVLVAAELIAANAGLGFLIQDARYNLQTDLVLVGMAAIGVIGYGLNRLLLSLERMAIRWRPEGK